MAGVCSDSTKLSNPCDSPTGEMSILIRKEKRNYLDPEKREEVRTEEGRASGGKRVVVMEMLL